MRLIDVSVYKYNFMIFNEKFIYSIYMDKERMTTPKSAHASLVGKFHLPSLSILVKSIEEDF